MRPVGSPRRTLAVEGVAGAGVRPGEPPAAAGSRATRACLKLTQQAGTGAGSRDQLALGWRLAHTYTHTAVTCRTHACNLRAICRRGEAKDLLAKLLGDQVKVFTTKCVMHELRSLGGEFAGAARLTRTQRGRRMALLAWSLRCRAQRRAALLGAGAWWPAVRSA